VRAGRGLRWADLQGAKPPDFGFPLVVKPDREGSTVGITIVRDASQWEAALAEAARHDSRILAEGFVPGREITVGILNGKVLPAIEIVPKSGFYDYQSKYTAGRTEYVIPVPMDRTSCSEPRSTRGARPARSGFGEPRGSTTAWIRRKRLLPRGRTRSRE